MLSKRKREDSIPPLCIQLPGFSYAELQQNKPMREWTFMAIATCPGINRPAMMSDLVHQSGYDDLFDMIEIDYENCLKGNQRKED